MRIVICSSLDFIKEIKEKSDNLKKRGFEVIIPMTAEKILNGEVTEDQIRHEKETGKISERVIKHDIIRYYFNKIRECDAILVLNMEKKGIKGYIGGATFLEMGFAHVLGKKIFLFNEIPDVRYKDEIRAMQPIIINGDLNRIR
jgi:nucleoside 2-deoxyribosyltransferase